MGPELWLRLADAFTTGMATLDQRERLTAAASKVDTFAELSLATQVEILTLEAVVRT